MTLMMLSVGPEGMFNGPVTTGIDILKEGNMKLSSEKQVAPEHGAIVFGRDPIDKGGPLQLWTGGMAGSSSCFWKITLAALILWY